MSLNGIQRKNLTQLSSTRVQMEQIQSCQKTTVLIAVLIALVAGVGGSYLALSHLSDLQDAYFIGGAIVGVAGIVVPMVLIRVAILSAREQIEKLNEERVEMERVIEEMTEEDFQFLLADHGSVFIQAFGAVLARTENKDKLRPYLEMLVKNDKLTQSDRLKLIEKAGGDKECLKILLPKKPTTKDMVLFQEAFNSHPEVLKEIVRENVSYSLDLEILEVYHDNDFMDEDLVAIHATVLLQMLDNQIARQEQPTEFQNRLLGLIALQPRRRVSKEVMSSHPKTKLAFARHLLTTPENTETLMQSVNSDTIFDSDAVNRGLFTIARRAVSNNKSRAQFFAWLGEHFIAGRHGYNIETLRYLEEENLLGGLLKILPEQEVGILISTANDDEFMRTCSEETLKAFASALITYGFELNRPPHAVLHPHLKEIMRTQPNRVVARMKQHVELRTLRWISLMAESMPQILGSKQMDQEVFDSILGVAFQNPAVAGVVGEYSPLEFVRGLSLERKIALLKVLPPNSGLVLRLLPDDYQALGREIGVLAQRHPVSFAYKINAHPAYSEGLEESGRLYNSMAELPKGVQIHIADGVIRYYAAFAGDDAGKAVLRTIAKLPHLEEYQRVCCALLQGGQERNLVARKLKIADVLMAYMRQQLPLTPAVVAVLATDASFGREVDAMYRNAQSGVHLGQRTKCAQELYKYMSRADQEKYPQFRA